MTNAINDPLRQIPALTVGTTVKGSMELCNSKIEATQLDEKRIVFSALTAIARDFPKDFEFPHRLADNVTMTISSAEQLQILDKGLLG